MPSAMQLANRYAKSLMDVAQSTNSVEQVYTDASFIAKFCSEDKAFSDLLNNPVVDGETKFTIIKKMLGEKILPLTINFMHLLITHNRINYLPEMVQAFVGQYNILNGIREVRLTMAIEPTAALQAEIKENILSQRGFEKIKWECQTDPEIIGGFVLEFDNNLMDASVQRDLLELQKKFTTAY